jgi:hypothetical protein
VQVYECVRVAAEGGEERGRCAFVFNLGLFDRSPKPNEIFGVGYL